MMLLTEYEFILFFERWTKNLVANRVGIVSSLASLWIERLLVGLANVLTISDDINLFYLLPYLSFEYKKKIAGYIVM